MTRYFLSDDSTPEREVSKEEFLRAERGAGFHNTLGHPDEPATAGFTGWSGVEGRVQYEPDPTPAPPVRRYGRCPDEGKCHHWCWEGHCFRVACCAPLSGVYPDDEWPPDLRLELG